MVIVRYPDSTRFGAPARPIEAAGSVLRARASANGVTLRPVMPVDLLGAVIAADAWSALLGGASFERPATFGADATMVLAAILSRAAGYPSAVMDAVVEDCAQSADMLCMVDQHLAWASELCPDAPGLVLMRAGSDLLAAGSISRFAAYGALLQLIATQEP